MHLGGLFSWSYQDNNINYHTYWRKYFTSLLKVKSKWKWEKEEWYLTWAHSTWEYEVIRGLFSMEDSRERKTTFISIIHILNIERS